MVLGLYCLGLSVSIVGESEFILDLDSVAWDCGVYSDITIKNSGLISDSTALSGLLNVHRLKGEPLRT